MRVVIGLVFLSVLLGGCATGPNPATAIPYDPSFYTQMRASVAADLKADEATREYVASILTSLCAADGQWSKVNAAWAQKEADRFKALFVFQPIPAAPASTGSVADIFGAIAGAVVKVAPLLMLAPRAPLPGLVC